MQMLEQSVCCFINNAYLQKYIFFSSKIFWWMLKDIYIYIYKEEKYLRTLKRDISTTLHERLADKHFGSHRIKGWVSTKASQ